MKYTLLFQSVFNDGADPEAAAKALTARLSEVNAERAEVAANRTNNLINGNDDILDGYDRQLVLLDRQAERMSVMIARIQAGGAA